VSISRSTILANKGRAASSSINRVVRTFSVFKSEKTVLDFGHFFESLELSSQLF
jgi:hypothetical protein